MLPRLWSIAAILSTVNLACASSTTITSEPMGAQVYADGQYIGRTPATYTDTKIIGSATQLVLKKEGCEPGHFLLTRSEHFEVGPCIGGALVLVPFLWIMGYNPSHAYHLDCHTKK